MEPVQQPSTQGQPDAVPAGGQQQPQGQGQGVDPQMAAVYKRMGIAAMKIVYDENVSKGLIEMLKQGDDPAQSVAMAANSVLNKMKESVKGIQPNFVYMAAPSVIVFVCELGDAAGIFKADADLVKQATLVLQQQLKGQMAQGTAPADQPAAEPAPDADMAAQPPAEAQGIVNAQMQGPA